MERPSSSKPTRRTPRKTAKPNITEAAAHRTLEAKAEEPKPKKDTIHSDSEVSIDSDLSSGEEADLNELFTDDDSDPLEPAKDGNALHLLSQREIEENETVKAKYKGTGLSTQGQQRFALCIESLEQRLKK